MLFNHYYIDSLWIPELEESESSRAPCGAVSHHGTFLHFAEL